MIIDFYVFMFNNKMNGATPENLQRDSRWDEVYFCMTARYVMNDLEHLSTVNEWTNHTENQF